MPVNLHAKKQLVSRIVGVGVHRVRFDSDHLDDVADAITRDDIRSLITANTITIKPFKGTSRGRAKTKKIQKSKRGATQGSKKGRKGARIGKKTVSVLAYGTAPVLLLFCLSGVCETRLSKRHRKFPKATKRSRNGITLLGVDGFVGGITCGYKVASQYTMAS